MDDNKKVLLNGEPVDPKNEETTDSEVLKDQKKEEESGDDTARYSNRSNIIWMLCGAYLVYTGYSLISGFIKNAENSGVGFAIVGGVFALIGATLAIVGAKRWLDNDKKKREEERLEDNSEGNEEPSVLKRAWKASEKTAQEQQSKKVSIAERARLGSETVEEETEEDV
ncbi:MAG: hypothetical protein Q4B47_04570 [Eubacteriales bacterium]|nr:hypothetical protein [Eubacteriales bacterium]